MNHSKGYSYKPFLLIANWLFLLYFLSMDIVIFSLCFLVMPGWLVGIYILKVFVTAGHPPIIIKPDAWFSVYNG